MQCMKFFFISLNQALTHFQHWELEQGIIVKQTGLRDGLGKFHFSSSNCVYNLKNLLRLRQERFGIRVTYQQEKTRPFFSYLFALCLFLSRRCHQAPECHHSFPDHGKLLKVCRLVWLLFGALEEQEEQDIESFFFPRTKDTSISISSDLDGNVILFIVFHSHHMPVFWTLKNEERFSFCTVAPRP